jgi:ribonuclease J
LNKHAPADSLRFLPLGGAGEIGMNLTLYGHKGKWLMVDLGITFADETQPGIDVMVPDAAWIADRRDDLVGLVITHAHEDHLGAVAYLWEELRCPVYATAFAAAVLRRKLDEWHLLNEVPLHIYQPGDCIRLGPFAVTAIPITHSIPESQSLAIETSAGTILHTGDWKLDPDPLVGDKTDEAALRAWGDRGVLAMVCDSTNVFKYGESGSEAQVRDDLLQLCKNRKGRIAITTFASNIARVDTAAWIAQQTGRELCIVGRSLHNMTQAAKDTGFLQGARFLTEYDIGYLPPERVLLLCTGCQGETRGAMSRIAFGDHPQVTLSKGDLVIFSSRIIPGNERSIGRVQNQLTLAGMEVLTEKDAFIHVSGHPARDELTRMYHLVRPRIAIPVHGEARHIAEHVKLAKSLQIPHAIAVQNGDMVELATGAGPRIVERVPAGRLAVDYGNGDLMLPQGRVLQSRRRLMNAGVALVSLVLDEAGLFAEEPKVTLLGVAEGEEKELAADVIEAIVEAFSRFDRKRGDDEAATDLARRATRKVIKDWCGRRPLVEVHIMRAGGLPRPVRVTKGKRK